MRQLVAAAACALATPAAQWGTRGASPITRGLHIPQLRSMNKHIYTYMHICIYAYMHIYIYTYIHIYIYTYIHIYIYTHTYTYIYILFPYIYIYVIYICYIYIYKWIYIYVYMPELRNSLRSSAPKGLRSFGALTERRLPLNSTWRFLGLGFRV